MRPHFFQTRVGVFLLAPLCCFLWGSSYPAIKNGYALLHIAADDWVRQALFAGYRFVIAGIVLLVIAAALRRPVGLSGGRQALQVTLLGLTQTALQYLLFYIGLAHATGVKSSILNATGVFFSVAIAHFLYVEDRVSRLKAMGCLIGFLGVVVVNLDGMTALDFEFSLLGEGFVIIAAFILAAASIYGKRLSIGMDAIVMTGWQLLIGGVALCAVGVIGGGRLGLLSPAVGALLLYMALVSSASFAIWSLLLKHNPVGLIASFNFLVPVFGVSLSAIFLGESLLHWSYLAALILVCVGIFLVTKSDTRRRS